MLLTIVIMLFVLLNNKNSIRKNSSSNNIFDGNYEQLENLVKIEKAKLVGIDKQNRPYTITAEKAVNESNKRNIFYLYNVSADINRKNGNWLLINTKKAHYDVETKVLMSNEDVDIFYDDGSSISSSNMKYNFKSGLLTCNDGIVMFGKWGTLTSGNFVYNSSKEIFEFSNNPTIIFN